MSLCSGSRNGSSANIIYWLVFCGLCVVCFGAALPTTPTGLGSPVTAVPLQPLISSKEYQVIDSRDPIDATTSIDEYWVTYCVYPVSGIYSRFQRILFYLILAFTFCFRSHKWLLHIGILYFVAFTGTAALHGIGLSLQHNVGLDADHLPLGIILSTACTASVIFALYPPRFFNHRSSPFFTFWTIFLSGATMCTYWTRAKWSANGISVSLDSDCSDPSAIDCTTACSTVPYTEVLFRTQRESMVPLVWMGPFFTNHPGSAVILARSDAITVDNRSSAPNYAYYLPSVAIGLLFRLFIVTATYPPRTARNWIFRRLAFKTSPADMTRRRQHMARATTILWYLWQAITFIIWPLQIVHYGILFLLLCCGYRPREDLLLPVPESKPTDDEPSKLRTRVAKVAATSWYVFGLLAYVFWPTVLLAQIILSEPNLSWIPEQESLVSVDQWYSWVNVAFAVFGAIYARIRTPGGNGGPSAKEQIFLDENVPTSDPDQPQRIPRFLREPPPWLVRQPQLWALVVLLVLEYGDVKAWWKDPVTVSCLAHSIGAANAKNREEWRKRSDNPEIVESGDNFAGFLATTSTSQNRTRPETFSRTSTELSPQSIGCRRMEWASYLPCSCQSCQGKEAPPAYYYTEQEARDDEAARKVFYEKLKKTRPAKECSDWECEESGEPASLPARTGTQAEGLSTSHPYRA